MFAYGGCRLICLCSGVWVQAEAAAALDGRERDDTREQVRY